jgi:hypothetical protein
VSYLNPQSLWKSVWFGRDLPGQPEISVFRTRGTSVVLATVAMCAVGSFASFRRSEATMDGMVALFFAIVFAVCYLIVRALRKTAQPASPDSVASGKSYPFSEIDPDPNFPHIRSIRTKIRGVTKENSDGTNRQRIIRKSCRCGDALYLAREPNNAVDPNAIQVRRIVCCDLPERKYRLGEQLGYLSRELAEEIAPNMDGHGFILMAKILNVTGEEYGHSLGVNIEVEEYKPAHLNLHSVAPPDLA